jgi:hypothetical protein
MAKLTLQEELAQADRHIAEGEARLARQADLVARLMADGHDTALAEMVLETMESTLASFRNHREPILREIAGEL